MAVEAIRLRSTTFNQAASPSQTFNYKVTGASDAQEAALAVQAEVPLVIGTINGNMTLFSINVEASEDDETVWDGEATYQREGVPDVPPRDYPETDTEEISFDIATSATHITQSLNTQEDEDITKRYARTGLTVETDIKDYKGSIGVDKEKIQGTDILVPSLSFTITNYAPAAAVEDTAYVKRVAAAAGTTNDATFRGFAKGEVLFLGASGSKRSNEDYTMAFRFAANPNVTGLQISDIPGIAKEGWEYLWISYDVVEDGKFVSKRARGAYVERVYEETNFPTELGISSGN